MVESKVAKKKISYNEEHSFNKSTWKKLKPKDKDYYARDKKLEGFWIRVYKSGKTSYGCYSRKGGVGRPINHTIGDCKVWNFEEAKEKARVTIQQIKYEGINPKAVVKQEASKNKTLIDLAHDYFVDKKGLAESTKDDYIRRMTNRMPQLIKLPVTEITLEEIMDWWHLCPAESSDRTAFVYARKLMSQAVAKRYVIENNFLRAKELIGELPAIKSRVEDHISSDDMYAFFQAFLQASPVHGARPKKGKQMSHVMRDYLLFTLLTGKRREEVQSLTWNNVDFDKGTITLNKTKFSKVDVIPMSNLTFAMLDYRYHMNGDTQASRKHPHWVFQSRAGDGYIGNPDKALAQLRKRTDLSFNLSSHDFRRTFSTASHHLGLEKLDIAILLNHGKRDVTEGYITANVEHKRRNIELVADYYNEHSASALNTMLVQWYDGNSMYFDERAGEAPPKKISFKNSRLHLLGRYEDEFQGFGHAEWKPSKQLIKLGWKDEQEKEL